MTLHNMLQSPERDVLLVSALIATLVSLAFTGWGILAYVLTGLVFTALLLASAIANRRRGKPTGDRRGQGGAIALVHDRAAAARKRAACRRPARPSGQKWSSSYAGGRPRPHPGLS